MSIWNKLVSWFGKDENYLTEVDFEIVTDFIDPDLMPEYAHKGDAGMDVFAYEFVKYYSEYNQEVVIDEMITEFVLHPRQRIVINTGISSDMPEKIGIFGAIRSGLSTKYGLMLVNGLGIMDHIYKGKLCFVIANMSSADYTFKLSDKIGQLIPFYQIKLKNKIVDKLRDSVRGAGGFGSSGM